jgi:catechol 2,3-dioxygenase-like lactoylglutathione lyase family enzyme
MLRRFCRLVHGRRRGAALDRGLTHVAFTVGDLDASIAFYAEYAAMKVVHQRAGEKDGARVAWISDGTRPFVLVLIEAAAQAPLRRNVARPFSHLGVACTSCEEVDALCESARRAGVLEMAPKDLGPPVGYFGLLRDPDDNFLELSYGQEVGIAVEEEAKG